MKKSISLLILISVSVNIWAQNNTFPSSGAVGIGTLIPSGKFQVLGSTYIGNENGDAPFRVSIGGSGGNYGSIGYGYKYTGTSDQHTYAVGDYASQLEFTSGGFIFKTAPIGNTNNIVPFSEAMHIKQNGNVGIGTTNSLNKLQIGINTPGWSGNDLVISNANGALAIHNNLSHTYIYGSKDIAIRPGYGQMTILATSAGNVGIGITNSSSVDYKLTVNGKIKAEEVKVVVDVPADYVFENNYPLQSLTEVEKYVFENKHLPGIPSATELKENGWELGEMSNKMLEKIEELTLYMIDVKKENDRLRARRTKILKNSLQN